MPICSMCNQSKPDDMFYMRPDRKDKLQSYCKPCNLANTLKRQRSFKSKCIEYKGGKCEICGYCKCIGALEFHHKDPREKDFNISKRKLTSWEKNKTSVCAEIDKCLLLCANCHREIHESHSMG